MVELVTLPSALERHVVVPLMATPPSTLGAKKALLFALEEVNEVATVVSMLYAIEQVIAIEVIVTPQSATSLRKEVVEAQTSENGKSYHCADRVLERCSCGGRLQTRTPRSFEKLVEAGWNHSPFAKKNYPPTVGS